MSSVAEDKAVLPAGQVQFHPHSMLDEAGRVFRHEGGIYRAIRAASAPFVRRMLETQQVRRLMDEGLLVPTEIAPLSVEGYALVLKHRTIPLATYPEEWCAGMMKDAALGVLRILQTLAEAQLTMKDTHLWNVLFEGTRPVWVDFSSIVPLEGQTPGFSYESFRKYVVHPLVLMSAGQDRLARYLMVQPAGVKETDLPMILRGALHREARAQLRARLRATLRRVLPGQWKAKLRQWLPVRGGGEEYASLLQRMRQSIESIEFGGFGSGGDYREPSEEPAGGYALRQERQRALRQVLADVRPGSALVVEPDDQWLAPWVAEQVSTVAAIHRSPQRVQRMYERLRSSGAGVVPLVMDFVEPTPGRGLGDHRCLPAMARLQSDVVIAPDVVADVVFRYRRIGLEALVDGLAGFCTRTAIVEFAPPPRMEPSWYTLENLHAALRRRFQTISTIGLHGSGRAMLVCHP